VARVHRVRQELVRVALLDTPVVIQACLLNHSEWLVVHRVATCLPESVLKADRGQDILVVHQTITTPRHSSTDRHR